MIGGKRTDTKMTADQIMKLNMARLNDLHDETPTQEHILQVARAFNYRVDDPTFLYPLDQNYTAMEQHLLDINILFGVVGSGRKSCIRFANRYKKYGIVQISCSIYTTETQFVQKLFRQVCRVLGQSAPTSDNISLFNLSSLTPLVLKQRKPLILIIDHCERLNQIKRQGVLYNLLEWVKKQVHGYFGIHLLTSQLTFLEKVQKRVKSRLTSQSFFFSMPQVRTVLEVLKARVDYGATHIKLADKLKEFIDSKPFVQLVQKTLPFTLTIMAYVNAFKYAFCGLTSDIVRKWGDHGQLLFSTLLNDVTEALDNMSISMSLNIIKGMCMPALMVLAVIINMIGKNCSCINLQTIYREFVKIRRQLKERQGVGSSFEYTEAHFEKGLRNLLENKIVFQDDEFMDDHVFVGHPILEISILIKELKTIPLFIKDILTCEIS